MRMLSKFIQYIIFLLVVLTQFVCTTSTKNSDHTNNDLTTSKLDEMDILGYKKFRIFKGRHLMGYVVSDSDSELFVEQVWTGTIKKSSPKKTLHLKYNQSNFKDVRSGLKDYLTINDNLEQFKEIRIQLINPTEYILENPKIRIDAKDSKHNWNKNFVVALLKVQNLSIELESKDGRIIKSSKDLSKIIQFHSDVKEKENTTIFARNVYVGYKMNKASQSRNRKDRREH